MAEQSTRLDPWWLALGTLTAFTVPAPRQVDRRTAGRAMLLAPVAALAPAALATAVAAAGLALQVRPDATAALTVATLALATRGLHLDGLGDTADGLAAGFDRDRALEVMRRGDSGPAAVAAIGLTLLIQVLLLGQLLAGSSASGLCAVAVCVVIARSMLPLACRRGIKAARPDGLGAAVVGTLAPGAAAVAVGMATAAATVALWLAGWPWWAGPSASVAATASTLWLLARVGRRFGGVTGDVLGAVVEAGTGAALLALVIVG